MSFRGWATWDSAEQNQELEDAWPHLSFWLWSITQHVAEAGKERNGERLRPPIILLGTKMGDQKINELELDDKIQELMLRVPDFRKQLQRGPKHRTGDALKSKWLFPLEAFPQKEVKEWQRCTEDLREAIERLAFQMVTPREEYPQELADTCSRFAKRFERHPTHTC